MLSYLFPSKEVYNEETNEFTTIGGERYFFELSLRGIAEWEAENERPFFATKLNAEDAISIVDIMCMDNDYFDERLIDAPFLSAVNSYISKKNTATVIHNEDADSKTGSFITSEVIYAMMFELSIPIECENWNINRLMTLIKVMQIRSQPSKKMSRAKVASENQRLNALRRSKLNSKG